MNILLTGGAGYIGSHTALSLINSGHSVTVIDNLIKGGSGQAIQNMNQKFKFKENEGLI